MEVEGKRRPQKVKTRHPWIYQLANGKYQATWKDPGGRHRARTFDRLLDAIAHRSKVVADPESGRKPSKKTLDEFWPHFMRTGSKRGEYEESTKALYEQQYRRHIQPRFGHWPLSRISEPDVADMIADMLEEGVGRATISQVRRLLHRIFEVAGRDEKVKPNPVSDVPAPKAERKPITTYSAKKLEAHAEAAGRVGGSGDAVMVRLMGWTGLRISEAAGLRVGDFDPSSGMLTIREARKEVGGRVYTGTPKGDRFRQFTLPTFVRDMLVQHMETQGIGEDPEVHVFRTKRGNPITPSNWRDRVWYPAARAAGVARPPRPHHLRHTAVSLMRAAGIPTHVVMEVVGHSTVAMSGQYTHATKEDLDAAAKVMQRRYGGKKASPVSSAALPLEAGRVKRTRRPRTGRPSSPAGHRRPRDDSRSAG
jgi:integrase